MVESPLETFLILRILLVTSWFLSLNRPYISPYLEEFIRGLAAHGIDVSVYSPRATSTSKFEGKGNVHFHKAITPLGFARFLVEIVSTPAAILHVQRPNTYATPFIAAARLFRKPVVVTIHRAEVLPYHPQPWGFLRRFALRIISEAICVSDSTRRLAVELGSPPGRSVVIYNTVDQRRFRPRPLETARHLLGLPADQHILLYVGGLRPEKGCETLVRAFASVAGPCLLLMVGDGPLRRELESLANTLGLHGKVSFLGGLPHSSELLPVYYNASDVFVLVSVTEGHSLALLEALASGLPIVATNVGGNLETIEEGTTGILVHPGDVGGLRTALERLLSNIELQARMRVAARDSSLRRFGEDEQFGRIFAIYHSLLLGS